jgi:hypothetical protein
MSAYEHAHVQHARQALLAIEAQADMSATNLSILPIAVRVKKRGLPAIWLPLFLFWPFIIALFCLALPLCVLSPAPRKNAFALLGTTYQMLCALRGTQVEVTGSEHGTWSISLY